MFVENVSQIELLLQNGELSFEDGVEAPGTNCSLPHHRTEMIGIPYSAYSLSFHKQKIQPYMAGFNRNIHG